MGRGDELGDRVFGADVTQWRSGPRAVGRDVCRHCGPRSVSCLPLVSRAVAAALLGASAAGPRSDDGAWGRLPGDRRGAAAPGASDVSRVAARPRGHPQPVELPELHEPGATGGRAAAGSWEDVWGAEDGRPVPGNPPAASGLVDIRAGRRGRTDAQGGGEGAPSRYAVAQGKRWHAE